MSETLDRARREIAELRAIINAQQSGLPARLGVIVYSDDPTHVENKIKALLAPYGLATIDEAKAAGCDVNVLCLPYCNGRQVDKMDPQLIEALKNAGKGTDDPLSVGVSVGNDTEHAGSPTDQGTRTDNRSAYCQQVDQ